MKDKMKTLFEMLFNNAAVIKMRKASFFFIALLFLINVSLVSAPYFITLAQGIDNIRELEDVHEAFETMYLDRLPCHIDEEKTMHCAFDDPRQYGDYTVIYMDVFDTDGIETSTIIFAEKYAAVIHVDEDNQAFMMGGSYDLLATFDFQTIVDEQPDDMTQGAYFEYVTERFIGNLYYADFGDNLFIVYTTQFGQMLIYMMIVSILFMVINYKEKIKKITYSASVKLVVASMTGPALIAAIVGLIVPAWAYMIFIFIYAFRILIIYLKILNTQEPLY